MEKNVHAYVVLRMKDNTNEFGGWLYISRNASLGHHISFSPDLADATLMTPEPAHSWFNQYVKNFPTLEKFEVVEYRTIRPKEALREL
jgi:hypothetical protein